MFRTGLRRLGAGLVVGTLVLTAAPLAQATTLSQAVITSEIVDREPADNRTTFPADIGQIACFTRLEASEDTVIYHAWKHGDILRAKVQLTVGKSPAWRTWSTKRINPAWTGTWTVDVEDADGNILKTLTFTVGDDSQGE